MDWQHGKRNFGETYTLHHRGLKGDLPDVLAVEIARKLAASAEPLAAIRFAVHLQRRLRTAGKMVAMHLSAATRSCRV